MSSLMTNSNAMVALQTLSSINKDMGMTQNRISTGYRVADASDNAAYWSIATTMRSDNKALSAVKDALGLGAATVDIAFTSMNSAVKVVRDMKAKLIAASQGSVPKAQIQDDLTEMQNQLKTIAASATFNGENWLQQQVGTANPIKSTVGSFSRDAAGNPKVEMIAIDTKNITLIDTAGGGAGILDAALTFAGGGITGTNVLDFNISAMGGTADDDTALSNLQTAVDTQLKAMTKAASQLGSFKKRVDMQKEFVGQLTDAVDRGIGQLVDADMNAESTRLKALQTQQQLGIQALNIANQGAQNILSLFR
ncbi:flagellin [Polycladidibacter stylochi]|uniref:flagellin N-terminal helical domain-containing protein n=1 Tax=Polycladidibacter stylochi TaxID=1807766 RepID=UPI000830A022|nr:flagellin [Pseudovibrio stylochi]